MENIEKYWLSEKINEHLYYIGVNDRKTEKFEAMWPIPNGIAYNSYLLKGEKNILLDTVDINSLNEYLNKLKDVLNDEKIDYIVIHHVEPDHSSSLKNILSIYPEAQIICNNRTVSFLKTYYNIEKNIIIVNNGETLELGNRKLTFYMTPMVHWPESMVSYEEETKTLFSQDIFGNFGAINGSLYDDEVKFDEILNYEIARYFTNVVGKYSKQAEKTLLKLLELDIEMICAVHGIIWRKNIKEIFDKYLNLARQKTENSVVIIYGSIYGNTAIMAEEIAKGVRAGGITNIKIRNISKIPLSYLLTDTWTTKGIILGSCTYDNDLFPPMKFLLDELIHQKMKNNIWGIFGSFSWSGGGLKGLKTFMEEMKYNPLETQIEIKGAANEEQLRELFEFGKSMSEAILKSNN